MKLEGGWWVSERRERSIQSHIDGMFQIKGMMGSL